MKKIFIKCIVISLIISCSNEPQKSVAEKYEDKISYEIERGIRKDTIYKEYVFGMSEKEFDNKTFEYDKDGSLYTDSKYSKGINLGSLRILIFNIYLKDGIYHSFMQPYFYNKQLYKIVLDIKHKEVLSNYNGTIELIELYNDKYGSYFIKLAPTSYEKERYIWINGNREIIIQEGYSDGTEITYTNLLVQKEIENAKMATQKEIESENIRKAKKTINEI